MSQYQLAKHTLLPLIYRIVHQSSLCNHHIMIDYALRDPQTFSLILMHNSEQQLPPKHHISRIQNQFNCKLSHIFTNRNNIIEQNSGIKMHNPPSTNALKPYIIGDLSICYIAAPGYHLDYHLIAVTHMTSTSTKLPIIFPGLFISSCSIDLMSTCSSSQYLSSLKILNYFFNQTYIFPNRPVDEDDLHFALSFEPQNTILHKKLKLFDKHPQLIDKLIPTTIMEEKMTNPFWNPEKYRKILVYQEIYVQNGIRKIEQERLIINIYAPFKDGLIFQKLIKFYNLITIVDEQLFAYFKKKIKSTQLFTNQSQKRILGKKDELENKFRKVENLYKRNFERLNKFNLVKINQSIHSYQRESI